MENILSNENSKYSFWTLLSQYKIEIPIIQRDYAQGRKDENVVAIREELLTTIYDALINEHNIDFDFVYGTVKNGTLYPLDGQQRLTTLFLLHWYLACKEGRMADARDTLSKFTYTTRISSSEFCETLTNLNYMPSSDESVSHFIKNQNSYFMRWDADLTISGMLIMLDAIHNKFQSVDKPLFDLLTCSIDENPIVTFNYLPMENYALTDDLYIKMNARGKALSDFENFKAKFIQHLKESGFNHKHFEDSIDRNWTDLLWDYRSANNTIDTQFMYLFTFLTEMLFTEYSPKKDMDSPFRANKIRDLIKFYDSNEKVEKLYDLLDLWKSKQEVDTCLSKIFSLDKDAEKVQCFSSSFGYFESCLNGNKLTTPNKVILFLIMKRCIYFNKLGKQDPCLNDFVRIIRNFVCKVRMRNKDRFSSDFRFGRHAIPYVQYFEEKLICSENIYHDLLSLVQDERINSESLKAEINKAELIINSPEIKPLIHKLEDLPVFETCIHNVLDYAVESRNSLLPDEIEKIFRPEYFSLIVRALMSIYDYGVHLGSSVFGERYYYGSKYNWHTILTLNDDISYKTMLTEFFRQYFASERATTTERLNEICEKNIRNYSISDWQYYVLKYPKTIDNIPGFIDSTNLVILLEKQGGDSFEVPHRLNGPTLTGYHICALYLPLIDILKPLREINFIRGFGADGLGEIQISENVSVVCDSEVNALVYYDDDDYFQLIDDTLAEITTSDEYSSLDYIERIIKICKALYAIEYDTADIDLDDVTPIPSFTDSVDTQAEKPSIQREGLLVSVLDRLATEFPEIEITGKNAKGVDDKCRWLYPKALTRKGNVFMEVWDHSAHDYVDFIIYKELLSETDYEEASSKKDASSNRVILKYIGMTEQTLLSFVREKTQKYISIHNEQ